MNEERGSVHHEGHEEHEEDTKKNARTDALAHLKEHAPE